MCLAAGSFPRTKAAGLKVSTRPRKCPKSSGAEQQKCSTGLSECAERPLCNRERIIRRAKSALNLLDVSLRSHHASAQPRSAAKVQQRSLRRLRNGALKQQRAQERREKRRQYCATGKWQLAHYTGPGASCDDNNDNDGDDYDDRISLWSFWSDTVVEMARACAPNYRRCATYCELCPGGTCNHVVPIHRARFCKACIRAREGWRVVATYLPPDHDSACYYLAINPVGSRAVLSAIQLTPSYREKRVGWDDDGYPIYLYEHMDLTSHILEHLDAAIRSRSSPMYASTWLIVLRCAVSRLDRGGPEQLLPQQTIHKEALLALYATLLWRWSQLSSAGQSASWQNRVWTSERYQAIVRLQARVRGWLTRRSLCLSSSM